MAYTSDNISGISDRLLGYYSPFLKDKVQKRKKEEKKTNKQKTKKLKENKNRKNLK